MPTFFNALNVPTVQFEDGLETSKRESLDMSSSLLKRTYSSVLEVL